MRVCRLARPLVLGVALTVAAASPTMAAKPDSGMRLNLDFARTSLTAGGLWECGEGQDAAGATLAVGFVVGHDLQIPIGVGKPSSWTDVDPMLSVFGCDGEYDEFSWVSYDLTGRFDASAMTIDPFTSATLRLDTPMYRDGAVTGVHIAFDLTWTATGAPTVTVHHEPGNFGVERTAPAVVTGTAVVYGLEGQWDYPLTFSVVENADNTTLGWATSVAVP